MVSRLLIADSSGEELFEIDPDGADDEGTRLRALPSELTEPQGMTVLGSRLLIADSSGEELFEIDPDGADDEGTRLRALPPGLEIPLSMTVLGSRLLIADSAGDELFEIDPDGADDEGTRLRALPPGLETPQGMAVLGSRLLVADTTGDELFEFDPDGADDEGTRLRALPSELTAPLSMTVLGSRLLIADNTGDELFEIDPDGADDEGTRLRALPPGLETPLSMAVLPPATVVPAFADDTGDAQSWTQNQAITPITVPEASGTPAPTYAEVGSLPAGIVFDGTTRVISGTPNAAGSGTITIRATNSAGDADWTVDYTTVAIPVRVRATAASGVPTVAARVRTTPPPVQIQATASTGVPTVSARVRTALALTLADFDQTGLEIDALALIQAGLDINGDNRTYYANSNRPPVTGSLLDGELGVSATETLISRFQYVFQGSNAGQVRLNDNDNPEAFSWTTYFFGDGADLTLYVQTTDNLVAVPIAGNIASSGGGFVRISIPAAADQAVLNGIQSGDRFILGLARRLSARIRASASSGIPVATAQVRTSPQPQERVAASASSGIPVATAQVRTSPQPQERVAASASSGIPVATAQVRTSPQPQERVAASASSGIPVATAQVRTSPQPQERVAASASSGIPVATAQVRTSPQPQERVAASASSGIPVATAQVRTSPPLPTPIPTPMGQTISLGVNPFGMSNDSIYSPATRPLIFPKFVFAGGVAYLAHIQRLGNSIQMYFAEMESGGSPTGSGPQLTDTWEVYENAIVFSEAGGDSITLKGPNHPGNTFQDPTEPYFWTPDNGSAFGQWIQFLGNGEVTLTLDDGILGPLMLYEFPTAGRFVDAAVLLEASADALPVPSDIYVDADRGGTDVPLDGEFGMGDRQVLISRLRRQFNDSLDTLTLNDNDNPEALSLGTYFGTGSAGSLLTMTILTRAGSADLDAATYYRRGGDSFAHWTLSTEFQAILDAIVTGDRYILAFWRTIVVHDVDAGGVSWEFAVPQPAVAHYQAHLVDAGGVSWEFAVPQPTVFHHLVHYVDAGGVEWTFAVPQPIVSGGVSVSPLAIAADRVSFKVPSTELADLVVLQWQNTPLQTLIRGILRIFRGKLVIPLQALEFGLDDAVEWQLDAIGSRLNFPRPVVLSLTEPVFGFEGSASHVVGFDQGYFRSTDDSLSPRLGIDDERYRRLLKMRARTMVSRYTTPELDYAVQAVVEDALYQDHANLNLTLYVGTALTDYDKSIYRPHWPKPAGVGLTINDTVALPI